MKNHRPLEEQTVVIIGASSGIGRSAALQFAAKGSNVLVAARSKTGIETLVQEIKNIQKVDHKVIGMQCDVCKIDQVKQVAEKAVQTWGRIDSWVHTASVLEIAEVEQITEQEAQQVMDVNFMGVLRGIWISVPYLKRSNGALIVVGSVEGRRSVIYQGIYSASKHAVKAIVETIRMELYQQNSGVSVTEIIPPTMDTPFYDKEKCKVDGGKYIYAGPPLIYTPNVAADCILYAAQYPCKELYVGLSASVLTNLQALVPSIIDKAMIYFGTWMEKTPVKKGDQDNLYSPMENKEVNQVRGNWNAKALPFSIYNWFQFNIPTWPFSYY